MHNGHDGNTDCFTPAHGNEVDDVNLSTCFLCTLHNLNTPGCHFPGLEMLHIILNSTSSQSNIVYYCMLNFDPYYKHLENAWAATSTIISHTSHVGHVKKLLSYELVT